MNFSAAVLIGGKGRRFGGDKTKIKLNGEPLIERILRSLSGLFDDVLLVGSKNFHVKGELRCVPDIFGSIGSIGGIHTAVYYSKNSHSFICACDMPFVERGFIKFLTGFVEENPELDVVIPSSEIGLEPLCAVYSKRTIPVFEMLIKSGEKRIIKALDYLKHEVIPYEKVKEFGEFLFFNINTAEDLKRAEEILKGLKNR